MDPLFHPALCKCWECQVEFAEAKLKEAQKDLEE